MNYFHFYCHFCECFAILFNLQDDKLKELADKFGSNSWKQISDFFPDRTDVQCLHRWQKVLNPELVKGPWTKEVWNYCMGDVDVCFPTNSKEFKVIKTHCFKIYILCSCQAGCDLIYIVFILFLSFLFCFCWWLSVFYVVCCVYICPMPVSAYVFL